MAAAAAEPEPTRVFTRKTTITNVETFFMGRATTIETSSAQARGYVGPIRHKIRITIDMSEDSAYVFNVGYRTVAESYWLELMMLKRNIGEIARIFETGVPEETALALYDATMSERPWGAAGAMMDFLNSIKPESRQQNVIAAVVKEIYSGAEGREQKAAHLGQAETQPVYESWVERGAGW